MKIKGGIFTVSYGFDGETQEYSHLIDAIRFAEQHSLSSISDNVTRKFAYFIRGRGWVTNMIGDRQIPSVTRYFTIST
jgi:hypothetical protein